MQIPRSLEKNYIISAAFELESANRNGLGDLISLANSMDDILKELLPNAKRNLQSRSMEVDRINSTASLSIEILYEDENFVVLVDSNRIVVESVADYGGWEGFSKLIFGILDRLSIPKDVGRLGLRYINVFPHSDKARFLPVAKVTAPIAFTNINSALIESRQILEVETILVHLRYFQDARIQNNKREARGECLDIDSSRKDIVFQDQVKLREDISQMHSAIKRVFFQSIENSVLEDLNPNY
jgi:uncharacterized protein (TIGR04255 family)